ncbi:NAD(P)/FAD-dependent oxidoreductase, partial [Acinetobacter baumannii]
TAEWPDDLSIEGKRVGVIGTGSTGTQFIVAAAKQVSHLTVFQRSAQYSVPSGNGPVGPGEVDGYKSRFPEIWEQVRNSGVAFGF